MGKNTKGEKFFAAGVLTSEQCLAMIEEKERSARTKKLREEEKWRERRSGVKEKLKSRGKARKDREKLRKGKKRKSLNSKRNQVL